MDANLRWAGGVKYNREERKFAELIHKTLGKTERELGSQKTVEDFGFAEGKGSTDVGDVSWVVPTAGLRAATWVPGTSAHSWQAVAAGGMTIGVKGMLVAAKTMALTAVDLLENPSHARKAQIELNDRRGEDFKYLPLLGDRKPPLDYRK